MEQEGEENEYVSVKEIREERGGESGREEIRWGEEYQELQINFERAIFALESIGGYSFSLENFSPMSHYRSTFQLLTSLWYGR